MRLEGFVRLISEYNFSMRKLVALIPSWRSFLDFLRTSCHSNTMMALRALLILYLLVRTNFASPLTNLTMGAPDSNSQDGEVTSDLICHYDPSIYPPVDEVICEDLISQLSTLQQHTEKLYRQHDPPLTYPLKGLSLCYTSLSGTLKQSYIIFTYAQWVEAARKILDSCHGNMGGRKYVGEVSTASF